MSWFCDINENIKYYINIKKKNHQLGIEIEIYFALLTSAALLRIDYNNWYPMQSTED